MLTTICAALCLAKILENIILRCQSCKEPQQHGQVACLHAGLAVQLCIHHAFSRDARRHIAADLSRQQNCVLDVRRAVAVDVAGLEVLMFVVAVASAVLPETMQFISVVSPWAM